MVNVFEYLFYNHMRERSDSDSIRRKKNRLEKYKKSLMVNLSEKEKRLLLSIIDEKDLIAKEKNFEFFIHGFKLGLKIGYESNHG